jgi:hypothetical protein
VRMNRILFILSTVFILSNCASTGSDAKVAQTDLEVAQNHDEVELVCTKDYPTGSRIPVKVCRSQGQVAAERRYSKQFLDTVKRNPGGRGLDGEG